MHVSPFVYVGLAALLLSMPMSTAAQVCGDVNDSGTLSALDALQVLKAAVGQPVDLTCDSGDCLALESRMDALENSSMVVLDGEGRTLGRLLGNGDGSSSREILIEALGKSVVLDYVADEDETGFPPIGAYDTVNLYFPEPECQGDPFAIVPWGVGDGNRVIVAKDGRTFVRDAIKAAPHSALSILGNNGCGAYGPDVTGDDNGSRVALLLTEVTLHFPLPTPGPFVLKPSR